MEQGELRAPVVRPDLVYRPLVDGRVFVHHPKIASQILDSRVVAALKLCQGQSLYGMLPEVRAAMDYDLSEEEWKTFIDHLVNYGFFEGTRNRDPRSRLFDPGPVIEFVTQKARWLFSAPVVVLLFALLGAAIVQLLSHWRGFVGSVEFATGMHPILSVLLFYLCFLPVGLLHELGHGVVCGWFGGEVLEVGLWRDSANLYVYSNKAPLKTTRARVLYLSGGAFLDMLVFFALVNLWLRWPNYITTMFLLPQALFFLQFSYAMETGSDLSRIVSEWTELPEAKGRWAALKEIFHSPPKSAAERKRAAAYLSSIVLQMVVLGALIWSFRAPLPVSLWGGSVANVPFWPPILYWIYRLLRKAVFELPKKLRKA